MEQGKEYNYKLYNQAWNYGDIQNPRIWSLWETTKKFKAQRSLEIGAGNYPKIQIPGGYFLDISESAIKSLEKLGGKGVVGDMTNLPFKDSFFDFVVATEVLEHIENDEKAFSEVFRVLKPSGFFLFSVPLRMELFSEIDSLVGHKRRYEIKELKNILLRNKFKLLKYRPQGFFIKILDKLGTFLPLANAYRKFRDSSISRSPPRFIVNLYPKIFAFLDRRSIPPWREDIENLPEYKDKKITIFCQKNQV